MLLKILLAIASIGKIKQHAQLKAANSANHRIYAPIPPKIQTVIACSTIQQFVKQQQLELVRGVRVQIFARIQTTRIALAKIGEVKQTALSLRPIVSFALK